MKQDIELVRKVNKLKRELYYPRLNSAFQSTICFFQDDEREIYRAAGSGLFLTFDGRFYVVTAAHVLAEHAEEKFVLLNDKELQIGGHLFSTPMPETNSREDDKIDLSIIEVDKESALELKTQFKPIETSELGVDHHLDGKGAYFCVGYPLTRSEKVWNRNEIKSIGYSFQSEPILDYSFSRIGFKSDTTIAIKYDGEVTSTSNPNAHLAPDITGFSGGGLWNFHGNTERSLIGVVIQREKETGFKAVLATKIDLVVEMIRSMR